jgi:serine/threonine-protein kinase
MPIDIDALRPRLIAALGKELQLGELLGAGGFGAVFRAHDPFLQRDVAIKVLDPSLALTADLEEQFLREARTIAGTEHPHIVPLYAAESREGLLYLVMRLLPGQALSDRLKDGKLAPSDAAQLALETARALAAAHAHGVVHRDIKPDNILLDASGHAIVTDFGISRVTARPAGEVAGMTMGTPRYMSPEQAMGEEVDGRSDVYSLGVVLFEMLTGRLPFEGRNPTELIAKHISAPPPRVSELEPQTPAALVALVDRMLAKSPSSRPDSVELVKLLTDANTPDKLLSPGTVSRRRWRKRAGYIGVAVTSAALVIWGAVRIVGGIIGVLTEPGADPALLISGVVPESLTALARSEGSLLEGEHPTFAFIPAGHTAADAMLLTDSVLIRRSAAGARRIELSDGKFDIARRRGPGDSAAQGYFIMTRKGERPETLYRNLSSTEAVRLATELAAWGRSWRASSSRPPGIPK